MNCFQNLKSQIASRISLVYISYPTVFVLVSVCDIACDSPCRKHHKIREYPGKKQKYLFKNIGSRKHDCLQSSIYKNK